MTSYAEPKRRTDRLWQVIHFPLVRIILAAMVLLIGVGGVQSLAIQPIRATASLSSPWALGWLAFYLVSSVLIAFGCYGTYVRIVERRRTDELSRTGNSFWSSKATLVNSQPDNVVTVGAGPIYQRCRTCTHYERSISRMATAAMSTTKRRDWRLIIWRAVAGLLALLFLVAMPGLLALLSPWLLLGTDRPGYTAEIHRFHEAHWAVINGVLFGGCLLALLRRPREQPLLAQFFALAVMITTIGYALAQPLDPTPFVILALVAAAYPAPRALVSVSREGSASVPLLGLSLLTVALLLPEIWRLVPMELAGLGGEHATEHHWILTVIMDCTLIAGGLLAATRRPGWKALGMIIGLAFVYLGVASISLPYYAGSWNGWGGALAAVGGCAFIGATVWTSRRPSRML